MTWDVVGLAKIRLAGRWRWIQAIRRCRWSWELVGLNAALQAHEQSFVKWAQTCSRHKRLCFRTWKKHPWKSSCVTQTCKALRVCTALKDSNKADNKASEHHPDVFCEDCLGLWNSSEPLNQTRILQADKASFGTNGKGDMKRSEDPACLSYFVMHISVNHS